MQCYFLSHQFQCLLSPVAFGFGCQYIALYEEQNVGINWSNIAQSPMPSDEFNMLAAIMMMLLDSVIYSAIAWYVEAVFPGMYFAMVKRMLYS